MKEVEEAVVTLRQDWRPVVQEAALPRREAEVQQLLLTRLFLKAAV